MIRSTTMIAVVSVIINDSVNAKTAALGCGFLCAFLATVAEPIAYPTPDQAIRNLSSIENVAKRFIFAQC